MNRIRTALILGGCAAAALPASAGAQPGQRDFNSTYPYASRLCAAAASGHAPKRLAASSAQIAADCAQLQASFTSAQNAFTTAAGPLKQQATDIVSATRQACQQAHASHNQAACLQARSQALATLAGLRAQAKSAAQSYYVAVNAARKTFWAAIRSLRGGTSVKPDATAPAPAPALPSSSAVSNA